MNSPSPFPAIWIENLKNLSDPNQAFQMIHAAAKQVNSLPPGKYNSYVPRAARTLTKAMQRCPEEIAAHCLAGVSVLFNYTGRHTIFPENILVPVADMFFDTAMDTMCGWSSRLRKFSLTSLTAAAETTFHLVETYSEIPHFIDAFCNNFDFLCASFKDYDAQNMIRRQAQKVFALRDAFTPAVRTVPHLIMAPEPAPQA